jgi:hypothetical protein
LESVLEKVRKSGAQKLVVAMEANTSSQTYAREPAPIVGADSNKKTPE